MTNWIDEPYSAAKFKGRLENGVDVLWQTQAQYVPVYKYLMLQPDTMLLDLCVQASVITDIPLQLLVKAPGGCHLASDSTGSVCWWENDYDNAGVGRFSADHRDVDWLRITKMPSKQVAPKFSNTWVPSTGTQIMGQIIFRVATE